MCEQDSATGHRGPQLSRHDEQAAARCFGRWPYDDSGADSARTRLARLNGWPQWISHEGSVAATEQFVNESQKLSERPLGKFTFVALRFPNHTDTWTLRDIAPRQEVRRWLREQSM